MGEEVQDGWEIKDKQAGRPSVYRLGWHKGPRLLSQSEGEISPPFTGALRRLLRAAAVEGGAQGVRDVLVRHRADVATWWDAQDAEVQALLVAALSPERDRRDAGVVPEVR